MNSAKTKLNSSVGFTLVEVMVSTAVLSILMVVMLTALDSIQGSWTRTKARVDQFRGARVAFEAITRSLSQATLNTYWDYYYPATQSNVPPQSASTVPAGYVRQSELQFWTGSASDLGTGDTAGANFPGQAVFFQAPLGQSETYRGLASLLNARGYYIQFGDNQSQRPDFLPDAVVPVKHRYHLMEYRPPAEAVTTNGQSLQGNTVYSKRATWYHEDLANASRLLADNILLLIISPQVPAESITDPAQRPWWIAPAYRYDSRDSNNATAKIDGITVDATNNIQQGTQHLLPPQLRVTMIAADESSVARWMDSQGQEPFDLQKEADAPFTDVALYDRDMQRVKDKLTSLHLNYRVFSSVISMRNASWDSRTF